MKWCPEHKFEVTFLNSLLCSIRNFRFIAVFFISLAFTLLLFLIISNIYTVFFSDIKLWIYFKQKNEIFGFNLYTLSVILMFILDIVLFYLLYAFITFFEKKFWYILLSSILIAVFVGWPFFEEFQWNLVFHKFILYKLSIKYLLFFLFLFGIWIFSFIFITFIVEKNILNEVEKNILNEKDKNV